MGKKIFFDLDGTLTDSGEGIINCASMALEHFGLEVPDREQMRVFVGPPLSESFQWFGVPKDKTDEAIRVYRSRYTTIGLFENTPYPGIREVLQQLQADGHKLYVATSKPEAMAVQILEYFDLAQFFDVIAGATFDSSRGSKSAVIAYLLEQIGGSRDAVMVGDTAYDVLGAKEHGIPTLGVSWGYGIVKDMEDAGAFAIAHNMEDLLNLLEQ